MLSPRKVQYLFSFSNAISAHRSWYFLRQNTQIKQQCITISEGQGPGSTVSSAIGQSCQVQICLKNLISSLQVAATNLVTATQHKTFAIAASELSFGALGNPGYNGADQARLFQALSRLCSSGQRETKVTPTQLPPRPDTFIFDLFTLLGILEFQTVSLTNASLL